MLLKDFSLFIFNLKLEFRIIVYDCILILFVLRKLDYFELFIYICKL